MAKSGRAEILKLLFWTGIFEILAKTLPGLDTDYQIYRERYMLPAALEYPSGDFKWFP